MLVQSRHEQGSITVEVSEGDRATDLHAHIVPPVIASAVTSGRLHGVDLGLTPEGRLRAVCGGAQARTPFAHHTAAAGGVAVLVVVVVVVAYV